MATIEGRIPPQALDAEMAVIGSLMLESEAFVKIAHLVDENSFYDHKHVLIFKAIKALAASYIPIDLLTVSKSLREQGTLEQIGGVYALTQLTNNIGTTNNLEFHARIVQQKFIQRELIRLGMKLTDESFDESKDVEEIINNLKAGITTIDEFSVGQNNGMDQFSVIQQSIREIEEDCELAKKGVQPGVTTGLQVLNRATGGWRKTNFILVASRPGVGKTSLALKFVVEAAKSGIPVNFYGLEMKASDLMRTIISGESEVNRTNLRDGKLTEEDWIQINRSIGGRFEKLPIIWNDFAGITTNHIKAITSKNIKKGRCGLVVIDYLQLITPFDKKTSREQQISEISRNLKKLALDENIPIIAMAQLNREAEGGKPELHHLRESGSLEQDADIVIMPWVGEENQYNLSITKNRRGIVGTFEIGRNEQMTRFYDLPNNQVTHKLIIPNKGSEKEETPF